LLDVAPKADGTLPEAQIKGLKELGQWMKINKEALYAAKPAHFVEGGIDEWRAGSLRFLEKGNYLYAIELGNEWPPTVGFAEYRESRIPVAPQRIPGAAPVEGSAVRMLGFDKDLRWHMEGEDLVIDEIPDPLPCDHAWTFRIQVLQ
jgi:alpha-L-fucosidase